MPKTVAEAQELAGPSKALRRWCASPHAQEALEDLLEQYVFTVESVISTPTEISFREGQRDIVLMLREQIINLEVD